MCRGRSPPQGSDPPEVLGSLLQVVEHPQLNLVWSELLQLGGSSIFIKDPRFYTRRGQPTTFRQLMDAAHARGETAVGWRLGTRTHLNPHASDSCQLTDEDGVIVIARDRF